MSELRFWLLLAALLLLIGGLVGWFGREATRISLGRCPAVRAASVPRRRLASKLICVHGRVFTYRGVAVTVYREVGAPHKLPHVHLYRRSTRLATFIIPTLEPVGRPSELPSGIEAEMQSRMGEIIAKWEQLNREMP